MSIIGRIIDLPRSSYQWGRFSDEYGNSWNIKRDNIPKDTDVGDDMAYRLDFSDPKQSPQIVAVEDD